MKISEADENTNSDVLSLIADRNHYAAAVKSVDDGHGVDAWLGDFELVLDKTENAGLIGMLRDAAQSELNKVEAGLIRLGVELDAPPNLDDVGYEPPDDQAEAA